MQRQDAPEQGPIFPVPPVDPRNIELALTTTIYARAGHREERWREPAGLLAGFGKTTGKDAESTVPSVEVLDKVWIPAEGSNEKSQKGSWKQQVVFTSTFTLKCPPSFTSKIMDLEVRRF